MNTVAVHLAHDSVLSLEIDGEVRNIELERLYGKRHYDARHEGARVEDLAALVLREHPTFHIGLVVGDMEPTAQALLEQIGVASIHQVDHHAAHAAGAFYTSPFEESLVVSYDGGGNDGTFRLFQATRREGLRPIDAGHPLNLGIPYRALAHPIQEVHKPDDGRERSNAGKLMGLAAFGRIRPEWTEPIATYFRDCAVVNTAAPTEMYPWVVARLKVLGASLGKDFSRNALTEADGRDLACTGQYVFENLVLETVLPVITDLALPVCITGGCALNVVVNQRLADLIDVPVFVPPNPNDCGLAQGAILSRLRPDRPVNVTYSGPDILDRETLPDAVARHGAIEVTVSGLAGLLAEGAVVAVMRGRSEHGPRALGHRSILCNPAVPGMKARLNERVKFREGFRPYAPVVRQEDVHRYFSNASHDLSYMSFNPTVRPEWRVRLAAAVHVDGTARVQTVTPAQNRWLHDVLTAFEARSGFGALVNTSFNSKGRPMVTRVTEALELLRSTDLDYVVIESWLFSKASTR